MKTPRTSLILATALLAAGPLVAGTTAVSTAPEPMMATSTDDGWQFTLGLYAWTAGLDGTIGAAGFTSDVDISFSDILDTLDMTAMGMFEARKGPWMFQLEGLYLRNSLSQSAITPAGATVNAGLVAKTTRLEPVIGYRVVDTAATQLDLLAGAVYYDISNKITVIAPAGSRAVKSEDNWLDPMVGFRVHQHFNERWSGLLRAEVGGFGVNADVAWQVFGMVGYDFNDRTTAFIGYRHAAVDYRNGGFTYDVSNSGPLLGLAISF